MSNLTDLILMAFAAVGFATLSIIVFMVVCYKLSQNFKINKR